MTNESKATQGQKPLTCLPSMHRYEYLSVQCVCMSMSVCKFVNQKILNHTLKSNSYMLRNNQRAKTYVI